MGSSDISSNLDWTKILTRLPIFSNTCFDLPKIGKWRLTNFRSVVIFKIYFNIFQFDFVFQSCALKSDKLKKKGDLFFEMVDMDKGVYGQEYNVSLFIHVNSFSITASHSLFIYNFTYVIIFFK